VSVQQTGFQSRTVAELFVKAVAVKGVQIAVEGGGNSIENVVAGKNPDIQFFQQMAGQIGASVSKHSIRHGMTSSGFI
jgi:hypothetical protein